MLDEMPMAYLGTEGLETLEAIEEAQYKSGNIKRDLSKIIKEGVKKTKTILTMLIARLGGEEVIEEVESLREEIRSTRIEIESLKRMVADENDRMENLTRKIEREKRQREVGRKKEGQADGFWSEDLQRVGQESKVMSEELKRMNGTRVREEDANVRIGEGEDRDRWPMAENMDEQVGRAGRTYGDSRDPRKEAKRKTSGN